MYTGIRGRRSPPSGRDPSPRTPPQPPNNTWTVSSQTHGLHLTMPTLHCYTHFHHQRSWDSFPTDHRGGTSRQLLHAVPSSHISWDCFFPLARGEGTNRLSQRTTHSTASESPIECHSKKTTLTTWEQDQMQVKPIQIWRPDLMNISHEHFHNDCNVTKQAS